DLAQASFVQVLLKLGQPFAGELSANSCAKCFHVSRNERPHQPRPDGSLVISSVASARITFVSSDVIRVARREGSESSWCQQLTFDHTQNPGGSVLGRH